MKLLLAAGLLFSPALAISEDEFVALINEKAKGIWTAAPSHLGGRQMKPLLGLLDDPSPRHYRPNHKLPVDFEAPDSFDSRVQWPQCKSISMIWDQGSCGSGWAVASAGAMSDRLCIHRDIHDLVSPYNLLTCCGQNCGQGCYGGNIFWAWDFWYTRGISTGGLYNTTDSCQPYDLPPCSHHCEGRYPPCGDTTPTPECDFSCVNGNDYHEDKTYGQYPYYVSFWQGEEDIKEEIMIGGPVSAGFDVYEDFANYKSGVYFHVKGQFLGRHVVRIFGWGEENNTPYWLIANSWNEDWGDNGLFKIKRGNNECRIEDHVVAALPM